VFCNGKSKLLWHVTLQQHLLVNGTKNTQINHLPSTQTAVVLNCIGGNNMEDRKLQTQDSKS
jgi:hypothetical protein